MTKMVCENPNTIFLPKSLPIKKPHEVNLKRLNKPKFKEQGRRYYSIQIPCGRCLGCRLDHANEWATRAYMETKTNSENSFITLTYNNGISDKTLKSHLPINEKGYATLLPEDMQLFLKRLRKYIWKTEQKTIKIIYAGEYGSKRGRPHYHFLCFGWKPKDLKEVNKNIKEDSIYSSKILYDGNNKGIWGKGFCAIEELNYKTACYTCRYTQKKAGIEAQKHEYEIIEDDKYNIEECINIADEWLEINNIEVDKGAWWYKNYVEEQINKINSKKQRIKKEEDRHPEFIITSRRPGIGFEYWQQNKEKIKQNAGILVNTGDGVKLKPIPRYFKKLWEKENWEEYHKWRYDQIKKGQQKYDDLVNQINIPNGTYQQKEKRLKELNKSRLSRANKLLKRLDI